jgi:CheY-like chemotaxis protein
MTSAWNILIVDDEPDVHAVTAIALKRKTWRNRPFELVSAKSGQEARDILARSPPGHYQVALVDVVMETDHAGLDLCRHIRENYPRSLRVILRTGQPGVAPEEKVLNEFDIDYYVAKSEATAEKLFAVVRAGLRASQDLATVLALKQQLQGFTAQMQSACTVEDLVGVMDESLRFLETKFAARLLFLTNVTTELAGARPPIWNKRPNVDYQRYWSALCKVKGDKLPALELHPGEPLGLGARDFLTLFPVLDAGSMAGRSVSEPRAGLLDRIGRAWRGATVGQGEAQAIDAGVALTFTDDAPELQRKDCLADLAMFLENWKTAYSALCLQEDVARERITKERDRSDLLGS